MIKATNLFSTFVFLTSFFVLLTEAYAQQKRKVNVVFILADDLGYKDLTCYGSNFYETPHLDKLAQQGMRFTNAYAAAANCAPSRACLLSGQNTPRHGVYTVGTSERGATATRKLIPVPNNEELADHIFTLPEALQQAGYYTAILGKWHLGRDPRTQGFDYNVAGTHQGHPPSYFSPYRIPTLADGEPGEYLTDRLTTEAIKVLEEQQDNPFFLYLPYHAVHTPLQAPAHLVEKYQRKEKSPGQSNAVYAAMIESLDTNIGRLLHKLDELKLAENTVVIFTSDNGGIKGISDQAPLRGGKGSYYEGGIRVPLIVRWPAQIASGAVNYYPLTNLDFYPTILEILKIKNKKAVPDGVSLLRTFKGRPMRERPLFWHFPIYLETGAVDKNVGRDPLFRTRPGSAMRLGKWKLHEYFEDGELELYDLENDPGEKENVADKFPHVTKQLYQMLKDWRERTHAPVPDEVNTEYDPQTLKRDG